MKKAQFYENLDNKRVQCTLCPHNCLITNNETGICKVRKNLDGILYSCNFGKLLSPAFDPIEKKPLYHFYPKTEILSIGSVGCNFRCSFCQNWQISQVGCEAGYVASYSSNQIVEMATRRGIGIAYTYNEPTIFYEFIYETAVLAKAQNLKNVIVSNGFINQKPLKALIKNIDAFNIDLKAFNDDFYKRKTGGKLSFVLNTLKQIYFSGKHLEITFLLISNENDSLEEFEEMINWISSELDSEIVLHISRYFPRYKETHHSTDIELMLKFKEIAAKKLKYVYLGNV